MADESADVANKEQMVVCFRWVDEDLEPHEDFVAIQPIQHANDDTIVSVLRVIIQFHNFFCRQNFLVN